MFKAIFLTFALAACGGGGGGMMMPVGSGGSTSQTCTEHHSCINGSCACTDGPKKGQSCCDPSDSSCAGSSNACDNFCQVCTSS